ncbi:5-oxoprolinase subunit PxpB [Vibrio sp. La 4.2.2]|uniref:5-oxoprolinase subunit PxpB n=1 Tax=unclassified Vibrio TaxID=2614977 RepID=UPI002076118A|nr:MULTISPECIES: 5-oxoprolinase subunit PxpB [unclassified Vibrio]MDA0109441.1 5-oxoprolinase subunit PxpB [Vibrio sp. La 4.2.2]USE01236.1 5-oxoprolinase subunit PxpB [Vibrio sp. SCSIO 43133]
MNTNLRIIAVSESALMVYFGDEIELSLPNAIGQFCDRIEQQFGEGILNLTPSYTSLLVEYHPLRVDEQQLRQFITDIKVIETSLSTPSSITVLPAYYAPEVGPELDSMSRDLSLAIERIIEIHSQTLYTVCAIGFAPGFAFLAQVSEAIQVPRLVTPRHFVPKGSIGIANNQTAVYPQDTPGGWQIIGNCPIELYNPQKPQDSKLKVGNNVRFEAIDKQEFISLGGKICPNW